MAGRIFVLFICATCIASIESEVGSTQRFNVLLQRLRAKIDVIQKMKELEKNLTSTKDTSNNSPISTLVNQTDLLTKNGSLNVESKNGTNYNENMDDEYVPTPTENPISYNFSQSTEDNSSIAVISSSTDLATKLPDNQTASKEHLIKSSSITDLTTEPLIPSTEQTDLSNETSVSALLSTTDDITSSKEGEPPSVSVTVSDTASLPSTTNLASSSSISSAENSDPTAEDTNNTVVTLSTEVSEDVANLSISSESTVITDKTELTTVSEENTPSTSIGNYNASTEPTDVTNQDTTVVVSSSSTKSESSSAEPKEITATDEQTQSSTKVTDITKAVTSSVFPSSSTSEEQTHTTVTDESHHIKQIYNPTITKIKLALSITFMVIALVGFVVLVSYMVKKRRETIPYEELSLEP